MIRELFKDIGKYIPSQIVPAIVRIVSIPVITRLFPPANYGNYILVLSTVTILATLVFSNTNFIFDWVKKNIKYGLIELKYIPEFTSNFDLNKDNLQFYRHVRRLNWKL